MTAASGLSVRAGAAVAVFGGAVIGYALSPANGTPPAPAGSPAAALPVTRDAARHGVSQVSGLIILVVSARTRRMKITGGCPLYFPLIPAPHEAVRGGLSFCLDRLARRWNAAALFGRSLHGSAFRFNPRGCRERCRPTPRLVDAGVCRNCCHLTWRNRRMVESSQAGFGHRTSINSLSFSFRWSAVMRPSIGQSATPKQAPEAGIDWGG